MQACVQVWFLFHSPGVPEPTYRCSELLLHAMNTQGTSPGGEREGTLVLQTTDATAAGSTDKFLNSKLSFRVDEHGQEVCFVTSGEEEVGVMMGWEKPISGYINLEFLCFMLLTNIHSSQWKKRSSCYGGIAHPPTSVYSTAALGLE